MKKTELCKLAEKYHADKAPSICHPYTPYYHQILNERRDRIENLLEIGIGFPETMTHVKDYLVGASLYMWEEYLPTANIYACDIRRDVLINKGRITSFYCDQSNVSSLLELTNSIGKKLDVIVDDGSHKVDHQILSAAILMPFLKDDGVYFIEDIGEPEKILRAMGLMGYKTHLEELNPERTTDSRIIMITKDIVA